jgi:hypothetical protein
MMRAQLRLRTVRGGQVAIFLLFCALSLLWSSSALAASEAPGWHVFGRVLPTNTPPGGEGALELQVYNIGAVEDVNEGPTVTVALPEGVTATGGCPGTTVVTCDLGPVSTGIPTTLYIQVHVAEDVSPAFDGEAQVTVAGGGALVAASTPVPIRIGSTASGLGFSNFDTWFSNPDGTIDTQAGSHPYELTVAYAVNTVSEEGYNVPTGGEEHDIDVNLPPGLVGNPNAVPQCTREQFDGGESGSPECPASSQVGEDLVYVAGAGARLPVYNLVPPAGVAAQFAFVLSGQALFLDAGVRTGADNGITEHANNVPQLTINFNETTIWGVPAEASHDSHREGVGCINDGSGGCGSNTAPAALLSLPTSCAGPQTPSIEMRGTWQNEQAEVSAQSIVRGDNGLPTGFTGCERLKHFTPSVSISPDTSYADTPAGLTVDVRMPQGLNPEGLATAGLKNTTVTLPEGVVINPGQATGLQACQPDQEGRGVGFEKDEGPPSCPSASKVGTDEIETPLLRDKLQGSVYLLQSNPPHLQLLVVASGDGVNLKLVGNVELDPVTGRLTTTFKETPDLPFTDFELAFSGGAQAALATPTGCGVYTTNADFTPWSTPFVEDALDASSFQITGGPGGSACASPLPFSPSMTAGATTDQAGGFTDFTMLLQRGDGQQRIERLQFKTPEGLLGMISQVPLCGEPQAASGDCSAASQIGHTVATAGPGPYPFEVPQAGGPPAPIYLTGPYEGAPYGLSIVVPVVAGPFNLGTVVLRAKIEVDPHTSQLTITTGALPLILDGIPTDLRAIDAVIDRPGFMFNPTDCAPMSFNGTAFSDEGASAPLESHFQVGSCQALKFQPDFKVSTQGKTSRTGGASLVAKIVYPTGNLGFNQATSQANIQTVKVELPKRLPSRLSTLQKACPAKVFEANPSSCPGASVVGHATALTPVLPVALSGPAYFVSHGGEKFPSLIVVLQGDGVTVDLEGTTFISKAGITSSTFKQVPDVPIGSFELVLPEGQFSALTAVGNLCKGSLSMPTEFTGQNGAVVKQSTKVAVTGCPKAKKATHKKKRQAKRGKPKGKGSRKRERKG